MNTKILLSSLAVMALSLHSGAQQPQAALASPAPQPAILSQININVLGQVNTPGRITLPKGSGLLDAIAAASGFSRGASPAKTLLIRKTAGDKPDSVKIDLRPILAGRAKDMTLRDGDTVVIGQSLF